MQSTVVVLAGSQDLYQRGFLRSPPEKKRAANTHTTHFTRCWGCGYGGHAAASCPLARCATCRVYGHSCAQ